VEPSTLEVGRYHIFKDDVTTHLPYRRSVSSEPYVFDGLMITEDNLILVKASHISLREGHIFSL